MTENSKCTTEQCSLPMDRAHEHAQGPNPCSYWSETVTLVQMLDALCESNSPLPIDYNRAKVGDDPRVDAIAEAMSKGGPARAAVETWLDEVFDRGWKDGANFAYSEAVMGALTAMLKVEAAAAIPLLFAFSRSRQAELALLRRFATNLLLEHGGFKDVEKPHPSTVAPTVNSPLFKIHHIFLNLPAMPDWQISHAEIYEYATSKHVSPIVRIYFYDGRYSRFDRDRGRFLDADVIGPLDQQMMWASGQIINMLSETLHRVWPRSEPSALSLPPPGVSRTCLQIVGADDACCPNAATHEGLLDLDGEVCWTLFCADHAPEGAITYSGQSRIHL